MSKNELISIRKKWDITQHDLAIISGIARATIALWETNKYKLSIRKEYKLKEALDKMIRIKTKKYMAIIVSTPIAFEELLKYKIS